MHIPTTHLTSKFLANKRKSLSPSVSLFTTKF